MNNIVHRLKKHAEQMPDKTAIITGRRRISYSLFFADVRATAVNLQENGFRKGDHILLFVPMSYALYKILFAIFSIGATAIFVETWADRNLINEAIAKSSPSGFVAIARAHLLRFMYPSVRKIPAKFLPIQLCGTGKRGDLHDFKIVDVKGNSAALVTFTTGSIGKSKAVKKTHNYLMTQHAVISRYIRPKPDAVDLTTFPVFFLNNIGLGITSVLPSSKTLKSNGFGQEEIVNLIKKENVSTSVASPSFFDNLADYFLENNPKTVLDTLYIGGAPVFPMLADKLTTVFPDTVIKVLYGSTEVLPISLADVKAVIRKTGDKGLFVGRPVEEATVKILKSVLGPVELAKDEAIETYLSETGEPGEVIVKGIHVLQEYLNSPELFAANKIVEKGEIWHRTGDTGMLDENGDLYLLGKENNKIILDGKEIQPFVVEQAIIGLPSVSYASTVQIDGNVYVAVELSVKPDGNLEEEILKKASRHGLNEKAVEIVFLRHIPRDSRHNSKVNYKKLRKELKNRRR